MPVIRHVGVDCNRAKVDVVTVPNLSEHLTSAETTAQLSARFAYAAAMKSINNLLLLGDGESWARQRIDFGGLPEMVRTFLQVAAGAADIPVTRLLGQSPAGLSATGESDVRNYYDMIAARQELDLRPQLERLDRLICRSEGIDPGGLGFAFRPLWQLDEPARAALALSRAQATQVYAGLKLWPDAVLARLAEAQLVADGTYPNAAAVFAEEVAGDEVTADAFPVRPGFNPEQPRDPDGKWTATQGRWTSGAASWMLATSNETEREEKKELEENSVTLPDSEPDISVLKPLQGMTSHGALSNVPMPIPPKALGGPPRLPPAVAPRSNAPVPTPPMNPPPNSTIANTPATPGLTATSPSRLPSEPAPPASGPTALSPRRPSFTPEENNALAQLFKAGGRDGNEIGAQRLLDQISQGQVIMSPGITRDLLERYAVIAHSAVATGIDKRGVQALRLKAIEQLLER